MFFRNIFSLLFLLIYTASPVLSQGTRQKRNHYIEVGAGLNWGHFTDFATSPLTYSGYSPRYHLGFLRKNERNESQISAEFLHGRYTHLADGQLFSSLVYTPFLSYSSLYRVPLSVGEKWKLGLGGLIDLTGNLRVNTRLQNNATGVDFFQTLFVSGKISRDVSRTKTREGKIWFLNYQFLPRKRMLSCRLNLPLMNHVYRNGFAYTNVSYISNRDKWNQGYEMKWFSGFRMSSSIDYDLHYANGNIMRFSYQWDAYRSEFMTESFQMAHQNLQWVLLFNTR